MERVSDGAVTLKESPVEVGKPLEPLKLFAILGDRPDFTALTLLGSMDMFPVDSTKPRKETVDA